MNAQNEMSNSQQSYNDEIDLRELAIAFWTKRYVVLVVIVIGFLIGLGVFLGKYGSQTSKEFSYVDARLTFPTASDSKYPNGLPFAATDIIASQILKDVYEANKIEDFSLHFSDFASLFSVSPASPNRMFIDATYKDSLANSKLSMAEIEELNSKYATEIKQDSVGFVRLTFAQNGSNLLPSSVVNKVLLDTLNYWANFAITQQGVLDVAIVVPGEVDDYILENSEYVVISEYLSDIARQIKTAAERLSKDSLASMLIDKETGLSSGSILEQMSDLESFHLNVFKRVFAVTPIANSESDSSLYLRSRIIEVEETIAELARNGEAVEGIFNAYNSTGNRVANLSNGSGTGTQSSFTPQYGDAFLSKLMSIGDELSDAKFKQELLNKKMEYSITANKLETELRRLKSALASLTQQQELPGVERSAVRSTLEKEVEYIVQKLRFFSSTLNRILLVRSDTVLGKSGALYEVTSAPQSTSGSNNLVAAGIKYAGFGGLGGVFFGGFLALIMAAFSRKKTSN